MKPKLEPEPFAELLDGFRLSELFLLLGWDHPKIAPQEVSVGERSYTLTALAEKRGVAIFLCSPDDSGKVPPYNVQQKIEREATKLAYEHLLIFADNAHTTLTWLWVARSPGQSAATRTHTWTKGTNPESLRQKLENIAWPLSQEDTLTLSGVTTGLGKAFDKEKVTKRFYDRFREEHRNFSKQIGGIAETPDRDMYTSVMMNRLMFIYFIQKKGFLNGDAHYLSNHLHRAKEEADERESHRYYRDFVTRLFHEGLGGREETRDPELAKMLGAIPYLNGGLFDKHPLEVSNPDIRIPDIAFENLFRFFETYDWHLDDRPLRATNQINPDVLGYIFEKYINLKHQTHQKEKGAYYTREDVTEYIGKNTIVPHILEEVIRRCPESFAGENSLWNLLATYPKHYIHEDMMVGVFEKNGEPVPPSALPNFARDCVFDSSKAKTSKEFNFGEAVFETKSGHRGTLPTETWREYADRRQRCLACLDLLTAGKIRSVEDLVTHNLNVRQFMQDIIVYCEDPTLLKTIWDILSGRRAQTIGNTDQPGLTILDPTCGSGAFLFAALNILEPIYDATIKRMEDFLKPDSESANAHRRDFTAIIDELKLHPSRKYFVFKSIILRNLFGVDIMNEAVDICKLRLYLKLVSQVEHADQLEPLPDIDFNVRPGNALIGYATEEQFDKMTGLLDSDSREKILENMAHLATLFGRFRDGQLSAMGESNKSDKQELQEGLFALSRELDLHLARELGVKSDDPDQLNKWRQSNQPFHWLAEYYSVMKGGGFDVVIGNPPYIAPTDSRQFSKLGFAAAGCPNLFAHCLERAGTVGSRRSRCGMIVPLSLTFDKSFKPLRDFLMSTFRSNWFSHYSIRPSQLFKGVQVRCVIHIAARSGQGAKAHTTKLHRWHNKMRDSLFNVLYYSKYSPDIWNGLIPKIAGENLIRKFEERRQRVGEGIEETMTKGPSNHCLHYNKTGGNWLAFGHKTPPAYLENGEKTEHPGFGTIYFANEAMRRIAMCLLNGKLGFLYWNATGDDFHVTRGFVRSLPFDLSALSDVDTRHLLKIAGRLESELENSIRFQTMRRKKVGNFNLLLCRDVTDESDAIFSRAFGFEQVWHDVELAYSTFVRPGVDGGTE